jgi:phosphoribosylamine---glycine ligase
MRVLVVGSGAREHAICWRLKASPVVTEVLCAPGNPGIAAVATCLPVGVTAVDELVALARQRDVQLTVVGPEAALAAGLVDAFEREQLPIVGPSQVAAQLESSKSFAKEVMVEAEVPTARYEVFTTRAALEEYCSARGAPLVLKADGLASGKGVFVIQDAREFPAALDALFGPLKAERVVAEDFLEGIEVSCIFASNGLDVIPLAPAHDYKRLFDKDEGPNTGGMGSVCPTERISAQDLEWIQEHCARPIIETMRARGTPFKGFLYAGLMVSQTLPRKEGIKVLEYNTRLGDPECQSILVRLVSDPVELFRWMSGGSTKRPDLSWTSRVSTCVVVASDGYPEAPAKGDRISGLELAHLVPDTVIFHAGTTLDAAGALVTTGGRTLSVVGVGESSAEARANAYKAVDLIQLRGRRVRRDIGI